jgi:hypothetical protein
MELREVENTANEKLYGSYSSPGVVRIIKWRKMRWTGHVALIREKRSVYKLLVEKPQGKRPLRRPRRIRVDNIKKDGDKIVWCGLD